MDDHQTSPNQQSTVVITGTTRGIGQQIARKFAALGWRLILVNRNTRLADIQSEALKQEFNLTEIYNVKIDLKSLQSVREAAGAIKALAPELALLINNAADIYWQADTVGDTLNPNLVTNYLGPFLLTWLLLDNLAAATRARIIMLTSDICFEVPEANNVIQELTDPAPPRLIYAHAKLAIIAFTLKLAGFFEGSHVSINCLYPGAAYTELAKKMIWWRRPLWKLMRYFLQDPAHSAANCLHLATDASATNYNGRYLNEKRCSCVPPARALDIQFQDSIWLESKRLTGLLNEPNPAP